VHVVRNSIISELSEFILFSILMNPMASKQFVIRFFCSSFLLLALIGLFNRIVDPFWYYRDIEIKGFNATKLVYSNYERHIKPALLMREQPEANHFRQFLCGNRF